MIKSSELNNENLFFNNSNNLFTKLPQHVIRAIVQKDILKRLMSGEEIDDIYTEIKSELIDKGAKFDTYIQENEEELEFVRDIEKAVENLPKGSDREEQLQKWRRIMEEFRWMNEKGEAVK